MALSCHSGVPSCLHQACHILPHLSLLGEVPPGTSDWVTCFFGLPPPPASRGCCGMMSAFLTTLGTLAVPEAALGPHHFSQPDPVPSEPRACQIPPSWSPLPHSPNAGHISGYTDGLSPQPTKWAKSFPLPTHLPSRRQLSETVNWEYCR